MTGKKSRMLSSEEYEALKPDLSEFEDRVSVKRSSPAEVKIVNDQAESNRKKQPAKKPASSQGGFFSRFNPFASCLPAVFDVENTRKFRK